MHIYSNETSTSEHDQKLPHVYYLKEALSDSSLGLVTSRYTSPDIYPGNHGRMMRLNAVGKMLDLDQKLSLI